jgi:hypothetical protein
MRGNKGALGYAYGWYFGLQHENDHRKRSDNFALQRAISDQSLQIKTYISNLVRTTRFWNNLHQVRSKSKDWKEK